MHRTVINSSCCTILSITANNGAREQKALISRRQSQVTLDARGFSCLNTWSMQRTGVLSVQKPNLI